MFESIRNWYKNQVAKNSPAIPPCPQNVTNVGASSLWKSAAFRLEYDAIIQQLAHESFGEHMTDQLVTDATQLTTDAVVEATATAHEAVDALSADATKSLNSLDPAVGTLLAPVIAEATTAAHSAITQNTPAVTAFATASLNIAISKLTVLYKNSYGSAQDEIAVILGHLHAGK